MVSIGEDCLIASWVFITDHHHGIAPNDIPRHADVTAPEPVIVGSGTWLGERSVLLPGVELGEGCVVGANAVVTKSFPPGTVLAGIPAKAIRNRMC
jgi:lipopolysaccharide O-acetyltransferase